MTSALTKILFREYRRRVLSLLILHPEQSYHVREIARITQTVPGTLHKELSRLANAGILKKSRRGNQVSYQADTDCIIYEELSSILRKTSGLADVIVDALAPLRDRISAAVVYGSVASGNPSSSSDVDLLIVGRVGFAETVKQLHSVQAVLLREINPKLYSPEEWQEAKRENSAFIREILMKPNLWIIGDCDEFG